MGMSYVWSVLAGVDTAIAVDNVRDGDATMAVIATLATVLAIVLAIRTAHWEQA